jgi:hypothetical protein
MAKIKTGPDTLFETTAVPSQKYEDALKELQDTIIFMVEHVTGFQSEEVVTPLSVVMREYVHWLYAPEGKHKKASQLLKEGVEEEEANMRLMRQDLGGVGVDEVASDDIGGIDNLASYRRKDGKTDA